MGTHRHLQRLGRVWSRHPEFFITTCVAGRRRLLSRPDVHMILREEWLGISRHHGWLVGRYVIMPDHVHFFVRPAPLPAHTLSQVVGRWKEWTAKRILHLFTGPAPLWQAEFFDHLLRSRDSRVEKWNYVRENPVRAGLVAAPEDWPYAGSIDYE